MTVDQYLPLAGFAFVASISPGPSNVMLLASGANFGFARTIPQILGIVVGFASLLVAVGLGLGALVAAVPALHLVLKVAGGGYLLYLAWRIATARGPAPDAAGTTRPMTAVEAAAFQWVNPKGWVVALSVTAVHADPADPLVSALAVAAAFSTINLPTISTWAAFGTAMRGLLADQRRMRMFNLAMALLLVASLWPMLR